MTLEQPQPDSPDLTDEEIQAATTIPDEEVAPHLQGMACSTCGEPIVGRAHEIRRRRPHLYWRVRCHCKNSHETIRLFRMDLWKG
jgi:hypothetical protein